MSRANKMSYSWGTFAIYTSPQRVCLALKPSLNGPLHRLIVLHEIYPLRKKKKYNKKSLDESILRLPSSSSSFIVVLCSVQEFPSFLFPLQQSQNDSEKTRDEEETKKKILICNFSVGRNSLSQCRQSAFGNAVFALLLLFLYVCMFDFFGPLSLTHDPDK